MENLSIQTRKRYSLKPAVESIPKGQYDEAVENLMKLLGITTKQQFRHYLKGNVDPTLSQALNVEQYLKSTYPQIKTVWTPIN